MVVETFKLEYVAETSLYSILNFSSNIFKIDLKSHFFCKVIYLSIDLGMNPAVGHGVYFKKIRYANLY